MTQLLEKAISEMSRLPSEQQDTIAAIVLEELADERRWQALFTASQAKLPKLASKIRRDIAMGKFKEMGLATICQLR